MAKNRMVIALAAAVALALLPTQAGRVGAAGRTVPLAMGMGMGMSMGEVTVGPITAGVYRLTLVVGPLQHMYTRSQYNSLHPRSGEVMLSGAMMMGGTGTGMSMGMMGRHLELYVTDRSTMRAVTNAMVGITYQPVVGMGVMAVRPRVVPIATMIEIGGGMASFHYGNNVALATRTAYHVAVRVNMTSALFTIRLA